MQDQRRDTLKNHQDGSNLVIAAFGIENQTGYDRTMPVRVLGYDSSSYKAQIEQRCALLHPVITIVLNFSDQRWGGVQALRDLMGEIPKELEPYFQDYRIHVFDIAFLSDDVIASFQSDFRVVAQFFKNRRLGRPALSDNKVLDYPAEITEFLAVFTGDNRYRSFKSAAEAVRQRGESMAICWMAQELFEQGEKQGEERGEERGEKLMATLIQKLLADGRMEDVQLAVDDEQHRKELYREYGLLS